MGDRVNKSLKNMQYGMVYQIMYLILNFVVRFSIIKVLGVTALSLNGLFTEILSILSLTEMGVGTAITYCLYKPLAEENHTKIAQLMNLFKKAYHIITLVMLVLGLSLIPVLPHIVTKVEVSRSYLNTIYILFLLQTCASYINSYKALLLTADQKSWVQAKTNIIVRSIFFAGSLGIIYITHNFVLYVTNEMLYSLVFFFIVGSQVDKMYPYLKNSTQLSQQETKAILTKVKQAFVSKLSNRVLNSTDNILISILVGTNLVGIYSQYSMFINGFMRLFSQVNEAIVGSIGNIIAVETKQKSQQALNRLNYLFFIFASISSVCLYAGINPFLKGVVGKNYLLGNTVLTIVAINMFLETLKMPLWTYFEASGLFKQNQQISFIGCILNIITSIILGKKLGMLGIFIGTFLSVSYMIIHKIIILEYQEFSNTSTALTKQYFKFTLTFILETMIIHFICNFTFSNAFFEFILKVSIGMVTTGIFSLFVFSKTEEFKYFLWQTKKICKKMQKNP